MTLVVANSIGKAVSVVADTQIEFSRRGYVPFHQHAQAKIGMLTERSALAFAGDRDIATDVGLLARGLASSELVECLAAATESGEAQFILVDMDLAGGPFLRFRDGVPEAPTANSWIGDRSAFADFQSAMADPDSVAGSGAIFTANIAGRDGDSADELALPGRAGRAFDAVLENPLQLNVRGQRVQLVRYEDRLDFARYQQIHRSDADPISLAPTGGRWVDLPLEDRFHSAYRMRFTSVRRPYMGFMIDFGSVRFVFDQARTPFPEARSERVIGGRTDDLDFVF